MLATKLYIPPLRPNVVPRPRLIEQLNQGHTAGCKLNLIAAPAGFGKTTLASQWIAGCGRPTAWLSLDEGDSDPVRFLTYLVAAVQTIVPNIGAGVLSALQSLQTPPTEALLTALLNDIATFPDNFNLVLDDYHLIDSKSAAASTSVNDALTFLVEHQPPHLHLIITTREDPNLPLARLRVRNQLTELRVADLRFTPIEAAEFLSQVMGLNLSLEDIAALEARTEGWIAGLQLAALSMQSRQDVGGFIQAFAGDHRYVVDYLVEEVLKRQPEPIRNFLLRTAILDRLTGSPVRPSPANRTARHAWQLCSGATSSSFRWMISVTGIAIIICLRMCCGCTCRRSNPIASRRCIDARVNGTRAMVRPRMRSVTRWLAEDFERAAD